MYKQLAHVSWSKTKPTLPGMEFTPMPIPPALFDQLMQMNMAQIAQNN